MRIIRRPAARWRPLHLHGSPGLPRDKSGSISLITSSELPTRPSGSLLATGVMKVDHCAGRIPAVLYARELFGAGWLGRADQSFGIETASATEEDQQVLGGAYSWAPVLKGDREVLVEDVVRVIGGFQLAQPGQSRAGERVVQALRALVCLEAEVQAAQVSPQLIPVPVEALEVLAYRADVEVLVALRLGGGARVHVADRAAQLFRPAAKGLACLDVIARNEATIG